MKCFCCHFKKVLLNSTLAVSGQTHQVLAMIDILRLKPYFTLVEHFHFSHAFLHMSSEFSYKDNLIYIYIFFFKDIQVTLQFTGPLILHQFTGNFLIDLQVFNGLYLRHFTEKVMHLVQITRKKEKSVKLVQLLSANYILYWGSYIVVNLKKILINLIPNNSLTEFSVCSSVCQTIYQHIIGCFLKTS